MEACFPCLGVRKRRVRPLPEEATPADLRHRHVAAVARTFSFKELAAATRNFREDGLVADEDAALYKGYLKSAGQVVAVKLQHVADGRGSSEKYNSEFLAHALKLSALRHPNLVNLIGFCADGNHRILVHEYMPLGSLEDHLHDPPPDKARLDWSTRINIAAGAAKGLQYLHNKGIAYRCMRSSDILLGDEHGYHPKLSQCGLVEFGRLEPAGAHFLKQYYGFACLDTVMTGNLTAASSLYSFGVVLLEIFTGRRAIADQAAGAGEHPNIVRWAQPFFKYRTRLRRMADPTLQGRYLLKDFERAMSVAFVCVQQDPAMRPPIADVVTALAFLASDRSS
ncbi:hypothetical protein QYE76_036008 [Lolium multiflorum]|uniref:Protein kinase domain-containing protein n=1 Tax=Lolium multiflorum TaxID=4521 RepID=A0AAD8VPJ9_LOLMU|nr:hypothetical protein QYE76_036008 [Lolium multiflorum]